MTAITTATATELPGIIAALAADGVDVSSLTVEGVDFGPAEIAEATAACKAAGITATVGAARKRRGK